MIAWLTALAGLLYLLPELPVLHGRMGIVQDYFADQSIRIIGHVVSVVTGFVLILVALAAGAGASAWPGRWRCPGFSLGVVTHVFKGRTRSSVLFSLAMLAALLWSRDAFPGRSDPALPARRSSASCRSTSPPCSCSASSTLLVQQEDITGTLTVGGMLQTIFAGLIGLPGPTSTRASSSPTSSPPRCSRWGSPGW